MFRPSTLRRALAVVGLALTMLAGSVATASPASAQTLELDFDLEATTHLARLNQDIHVTGGRLVGEVDLATGQLTADVTLPPAETTVDLLGLPLARAAFATEPVGQTTGTVDLQNLIAEATSSFFIEVPYLRPLGLSFLNLVGNSCRTAEPVTVTFSGPIDLAGSSTFTGDLTIPEFRSCGLTTPILNLLVSGPGNTFTVTATPAEG